jgi:hypothetical protein
VQRHSEKCKQLREAHAARSELELQIAQLHALGPHGALRQRALVAEAALAEERQQWSARWQELRVLLEAGQLEALKQALDTPPHVPAPAKAAGPRNESRVRRTAHSPLARHAASGPHLAPRAPWQVATAAEVELRPVQVQPVLGSWRGKHGARPDPQPKGALRHDDEPAHAATATGSGGDVAGDASSPPERPAAAPPPLSPVASEAASEMKKPGATTPGGLVVPTLNVSSTDDFLSRLAAAESGER